MKRSSYFVFSVIILLALSLIGWAPKAQTAQPASQLQNPTPMPPASGATNSSASAPDTSQISELITYGVYDMNNQQVGQVSDLVINLSQAKIADLVVTPTGGVSSPTGSAVLLPWSSVKVITGANSQQSGPPPNSFQLTVGDQELTNAPPANNLQTLNGQSNGISSEIRARNLLGMGFNLSGNQNVTIRDGLVNGQNGAVEYIILDTTINGTERLIPVPVSVLNLQMQGALGTLSTNLQNLQNAPYVTSLSNLNVLLQGLESQLQSFWQNRKIQLT